jgi:hypothetical protein
MVSLWWPLLQDIFDENAAPINLPAQAALGNILRRSWRLVVKRVCVRHRLSTKRLRQPGDIGCMRRASSLRFRYEVGGGWPSQLALKKAKRHAKPFAPWTTSQRSAFLERSRQREAGIGCQVQSSFSSRRTLRQIALAFVNPNAEIRWLVAAHGGQLAQIGKPARVATTVPNI